MKLYKTKKNCGKLLLGILAFCTGMILLTGCGSSSEQKQNKNEETAEENKEENKVQLGDVYKRQQVQMSKSRSVRLNTL